MVTMVPWYHGHRGTMVITITWRPLCHGEHGIVAASGWRLGCRIEQVVGGGEREGAAAPSHERGVWGSRGPQGVGQPLATNGKFVTLVLARDPLFARRHVVEGFDGVRTASIFSTSDLHSLQARRHLMGA